MLFMGYLPLAVFLGLGWLYLKMIVASGGAVQPLHSQATASGGLRNHPMCSLMLDTGFKLIGSVFKPPGGDFFWVRLLGWLKLFGWSLPGLPVLAVLGARFTKKSPHLKLWAGSAVLTLFVYLFVPVSQGHGWGFRYFYSSWMALPLLSTAFLTSKRITENHTWKRLIYVLAVLSVVLCTTLRFFQVYQFIDRDLAQLPNLNQGKTYVCIVNTDRGYYTQDLIQNDPFLRESTVILRSVGSREDLKMMKDLFPQSERVRTSALYSLWEIKDDAESILKPPTND